MITFEPPNGELPAYFATPEGDGPWPGVVIVHDAFGLTSDIRRIADRVAGAGYLAIVPALYRRGNRVACVVRTLKALQAGEVIGVKVSPARVGDWIILTAASGQAVTFLDEPATSGLNYKAAYDGTFNFSWSLEASGTRPSSITWSFTCSTGGSTGTIADADRDGVANTADASGSATSRVIESMDVIVMESVEFILPTIITPGGACFFNPARWHRTQCRSVLDAVAHRGQARSPSRSSPPDVPVLRYFGTSVLR